MTVAVDVTITTYNHRPYIRDAIEGVLSQKTQFPVRLIIGDDCSTDGTQEVIREYAARFPERIRPILHERNLGLFHPDRIGVKVLRECSAKYVSWFDGDDYWIDSGKLQSQVEYLESHPDCAICHHAVEHRFEDGSEPNRVFPEGAKAIATIEDLLGGNNFISNCSTMFRRDWLPELPKWFCELPLGDWPSWCLLAQRGNIGFLNKVMAVYRVRRGSYWYHQPMTFQLQTAVDMYKLLHTHLHPKYRSQITCALVKLYFLLYSAVEIEGGLEIRKNQCVRAIKAFLSQIDDNAALSDNLCSDITDADGFGLIAMLALHIRVPRLAARYCFRSAALAKTPLRRFRWSILALSAMVLPNQLVERMAFADWRSFLLEGKSSEDWFAANLIPKCP
jgi:glycosyltransferase involved in cell wall biosynthesis